MMPGEMGALEVKEAVSKPIVPQWLQDAVAKIPVDWWRMQEDDFVRNWGWPTARVNRFRDEFWKEFDAAEKAQREMDVRALPKRSGVSETQARAIFEDRKTLFWIMMRPETYEKTLTEAVLFGLQRIRRDILSAEVRKSDGTLDARAADVLLKAVAYLDSRQNGALGAPGTQLVRPELPKSLEEIDEKIRRLEAEQGLKAVEAEVLP